MLTKPRIIIAACLVLAALSGAAVLALTTFAGVPPEQCGTIARLGGEERRAACWERSVARVVDSEGPAAVLRLERLAASDQAFHGACHNLMHTEGRGIGMRLREARDVTATMAELPDDQTGTCGAGMTHGVFEGYVERNGLSSGDSSAFTIMCGEIDARLARYDCAHGLGHAATRENGLDVAPSFEFCGSMAQPDRGDCESAVLMTHVEGPLLTGGPAAELETGAELQQYCVQFDDATARIACNRWIPLARSFSEDITAAEVVEACSLTDAEAERMACFTGIGRQSPGTKVESCSGLPDRLAEASCSYGLLVGWVINRVDVAGPVAGAQCARREPGHLQDACYLGLGRVVEGLRVTRSSGAAPADRCAAVVGNAGTGTDRARAIGWCERGSELAWQPLDFSDKERAALLAVT